MKEIFGCVILLIVFFVLDFLWAWIFQLLWNWLMPLIFHLPALTYWQAFGCVLFLNFVAGFFKSISKEKE